MPQWMYGVSLLTSLSATCWQCTYNANSFNIIFIWSLWKWYHILGPVIGNTGILCIASLTALCGCWEVMWLSWPLVMWLSWPLVMWPSWPLVMWLSWLPGIPSIAPTGWPCGGSDCSEREKSIGTEDCSWVSIGTECLLLLLEDFCMLPELAACPWPRSSEKNKRNKITLLFYQNLMHVSPRVISINCY